MSIQMQLRGGTTAENLLFTGAQREVTVDTDKNALVVHDGVTPGGFPVATESQVADGTYFYADDVSGGSSPNAYILVPQVNTNQPNSYMNGIVLGFVTANANTGPSSANFQGLGVKNIKYPGGVDPAPGEIFGRVTVIYDSASDWLELQPKPTQAQAQIRSVTGSVTGNALTVTFEPGIFDFRSPILNNGSIIRRVTTSARQLTVPAGATLGTTSGVQSTIVLVAIDNAGSVELAVVNLDGVASLDETGLINTSAISAASTSNSVFYSQTARAGVPYRVVGFVQSTQAAAGTWSTPPSKVQGQGGQNIIARNSAIGFGQTWQDVTPGRSTGVGYQNTTLKPMFVSIKASQGASGVGVVRVDGVAICDMVALSAGDFMYASFIVPVGSTYIYSLTSGAQTINRWAELR